MKTLYRWWASLLLVMIIVQVGFAGYGAFYAAHKIDDNTPKAITEHGFDHGFGPHAAFGGDGKPAWCAGPPTSPHAV